MRRKGRLYVIKQKRILDLKQQDKDNMARIAGVDILKTREVL
jgi:hypothetical protein